MTEELAGREAVELGGSPAAIETRDLVVRYGKKRAVAGLNLEVPRGTVYSFLGPNGAGKTTTIKTLLGFRSPNGGEARVLGYDVVRESLEARARIGFSGEISSLYEHMNVIRLCKFCRDVSRSWDQPLVDRYLAIFGLPKETKVRRLSKGQKAQLELCLALGSDPELLVLDEPTSGLDPLVRRTFLAVLVGEVATAGKTVFFSTHVLSDVEAVADTVGIVKSGRMLVSGELDRLRETHKIFRVAYAEAPPGEEIRALRALPDVSQVKREGRSVRVRVRGEVEAVYRALQTRPYPVLDVDGIGMSLEDIFLEYIEEEGGVR
ncbi:MAG: ABC transporter ATP-binding protein [Actinobacteria bacterium]|nr:ABC transporter ATP-binding protein [Actinomycetota bacterium]